jgi:hypothetical protein
MIRGSRGSMEGSVKKGAACYIENVHLAGT